MFFKVGKSDMHDYLFIKNDFSLLTAKIIIMNGRAGIAHINRKIKNVKKHKSSESFSTTTQFLPFI